MCLILRKKISRILMKKTMKTKIIMYKKKMKIEADIIIIFYNSKNIINQVNTI